MTSPAPESPSTGSELVIVTGLSGSGKSVAMTTLEDLGYFCIDNLPLGLINALLDHNESRQDPLPRIALGLDVRGQQKSLRTLGDILSEVRRRMPSTSIFFLTADDPTLLKRYSETRRPHPLHHEDQSLSEDISRERKLLSPVADHADFTIDTSLLSVHQLRREICNELGAGDRPTILLIESFAFKRGVPPDVDFAFDVRCLPNPHWQLELRPLTGRQQEVKDYLSGHAQVNTLVADFCACLERWLPQFEADNRSYLTVGIGCTGGKHRSVYVADAIANHFGQLREHVLTYHRELI
ncbi:MAG: RNase adapter RapZ [Lysobacterales bacterium]